MCRKAYIVSLMLGLALSIALTLPAFAQDAEAQAEKGAFGAVLYSPSTIMYQGRLTNAAGAPLTDTVTVTFGIYADYSGGSPLWQGAWLLRPDANGIISQEIGNIPDTVFTGYVRYLQIMVRGEAMDPRQTLTSAPYVIENTPLPVQTQSGFQLVVYKGSGTTPIALGYILGDGTAYSGTGNFTSTWNADGRRYEITINGESFFYATYPTVITPCCGGSRCYTYGTNSMGGKLIIYFYEQ